MGEAPVSSTSRSEFSLASVFSGDTERVPDGQPNILTVCTGNICRSALAESVLATRVDDLDLRVHSAGTHALVGRGMPALARGLAELDGVTAERTRSHAARMLTETMLRDADLVLTMTAQHSAHAMQLAPSRMHRTFTVREFARLVATLDDEQLRDAAASSTGARPRLNAVLQRVADQRAAAPRATGDEDVVDPFRQSDAVYRQSAEQMAPGLNAVERVLRAALG